MLLAVLGFGLAAADLYSQMLYGGGGAYFIVVGIALGITGVLLYRGQSSATLMYALTLAIVWIWALIDTHGAFGQLVPRVALPTLLAFYIFSSRVRSRLA